MQTQYSASDGNVADQSGLRLFYTAAPRRHDAGVLSVGLEPSWRHIIPPGQPEVLSEGHCVPECTRQTLPAQGVTVFAVAMHTRMLGKRLRAAPNSVSSSRYKRRCFRPESSSKAHQERRRAAAHRRRRKLRRQLPGVPQPQDARRTVPGNHIIISSSVWSSSSSSSSNVFSSQWPRVCYLSFTSHKCFNISLRYKLSPTCIYSGHLHSCVLSPRWGERTHLLGFTPHGPENSSTTISANPAPGVLIFGKHRVP